MTSNDFTRLTGTFVESSEPFDYLLRLLAAMSESHASIGSDTASLAGAPDNSNAVSPAHLRLTGRLRSLSAAIRADFDTRKVWAGVEDLGQRTRRFSGFGFAQEVGETVAAQLNKFSDVYEEFVKTYSIAETFSLVEAGNELYLTLDSLRMTAVLAEAALRPMATVNEGESELQLAFSSDPTLGALSAKLTAINDLYQKLCELFEISAATNPLRIAKLETGTWAARLVGSLPVIGVMTRLIEASARYCYRNYTTEGKLSVLPRKAEAIEEILNLKKQLDDANIDTSAMGPNIQNASVLLAQHLNTLLGGEPRVVINTTDLIISAEPTGLQLGSSRERLRDLVSRSDRLPPPSEPSQESG